MRGVTLYHDDCLNAMRTLPDASVDAVIADPPYGTTACKWDSVIPFAPMWEQLRRVAKPSAAIVLFAAQPFTSALVMSNVKEFRYQWVWEKQQPTGHLDARRRPLRSHEEIVVFARLRPAYHPQGLQSVFIKNGRGTKDGKGVYGHVGNPEYMQTEGPFPRSVIRFSCLTHGQIHPTQKPVPLLAYLVRTYTNPGETVLDFCMGSGTTGVACVQEGRRFIGIEREASYYEISQRRIATAQPPMPLAAD